MRRIKEKQFINGEGFFVSPADSYKLKFPWRTENHLKRRAETRPRLSLNSKRKKLSVVQKMSQEIIGETG